VGQKGWTTHRGEKDSEAKVTSLFAEKYRKLKIWAMATTGKEESATKTGGGGRINRDPRWRGENSEIHGMRRGASDYT